MLVIKKFKIKRKIKLHKGMKIMIMSENSLRKDWDNKYDERWDKYSF